MLQANRRSWVSLLGISLIALSGCGGGGGGGGGGGVAPAATWTVGGTVSGLAWGYGLTLHNGIDTVTVGSAGGSFVFPVAIADGASYAVTVDDPPEMKCTVTNGTGTVNGANVTNVDVTCKNRVTALYPDNGTNWNDYVKNDGADLSSATGAACVGNETGNYSSCIHGGERRVFAAAGVQSCVGLTATDALDAFDWRCDESQGYVRFLSGRLKYDRRLADLIDFTKPAWKENVLTVSNGDGATVIDSASTPWWNNPLVIDEDGITSAVTGTIYLVRGLNALGSYLLDADKIGLVVHPGVKLNGPGTNGAVVSSTGHKHLWVEGSFNAAGDGYGVALDGVSFSVVRGVNIANASEIGMSLKSSSANRLTQLVVANNNKQAIEVNGGAKNLLDGVTTAFGQTGVKVINSHDNVLREITASRFSSFALMLSGTSGSIVSSVATSTNSIGLGLFGVSGNRLVDLAVAENAYGIQMIGTSSNSFHGKIKLGNSTDCYIPDGTDPGLVEVNGVCTTQGASDATLTTGITMAASFPGKVTTDDLANGSDSDGAAASFPATPAAFDWWNFDNGFRAWGVDSSVSIWTINTGVGRIYDWSAKTGDTVIKEVLSSPNGDGTLTHTWSDGTTTTFLIHAEEADGDGDGLCESYETCRYTANIGAYQGHGPMLTGTFTDGAIKGVKLLKYSFNGR